MISNPHPHVLLLLPLALGLLALLGACSREAPVAATEIVPRDTLLAEGGELYQQACAMCHYDGGGSDINPPLRGAPPVLAEDPTAFIRTILYGMRGPIERNGKTYNGIMPAQAYLGDREIAAIATYVRSTMGGPTAEVQPAAVAAERARPN